jgi:DNA-binding CsgD family transcriptional regulator
MPPFLTPAFWQHVVRTLALSPQQGRIVSLILQGKQDKEIAHAIGISRHTVRTHLRPLLKRHELEDRGHLVLRVFELHVESVAQNGGG